MHDHEARKRETAEAAARIDMLRSDRARLSESLAERMTGANRDGTLTLIGAIDAELVRATAAEREAREREAASELVEGFRREDAATVDEVLRRMDESAAGRRRGT